MRLEISCTLLLILSAFWLPVLFDIRIWSCMLELHSICIGLYRGRPGTPTWWTVKMLAVDRSVGFMNQAVFDLEIECSEPNVQLVD